MLKTINKAFKVELNPTKDQILQIEQTIGCSRLVFNMGLNIINQDRINGINYRGGFKLINDITNIKNNDINYSFLKDSDGIAQQQSLLDLDNAMKRFFNKVSDYPKFKSKRKSRPSYRVYGNRDNSLRTQCRKVHIPNLKWVKIKGKPEKYLPTNGKLLFCTISRDVDKYYCSLNYELNIEVNDNIVNNNVGIDMGINRLMTVVSDNDIIKVSNIKTTKKYSKKLAIAQIDHSRKVKGSKNREKSKIKVAKIYRKIRNVRKDYNHKITKMIVTKFKLQTFVVEDLSITHMMDNHRLAKSIADCSWYELRRQLEYKIDWYGGRLIIVPTSFPSTKTCSSCGNIREVKLSMRLYHCSNINCNTRKSVKNMLDRDINAGINLREYPRRLMIA